MKASILAGLAIVLFASSSAANIVTSESNLEELVKGKGPETTATVNLTGVDTQVIYTTSTTTFYLTQLCGSQVSGGVVLAVTGFGTIAQTGSEPCIAFPSGMVLPENTSITCSTTPAAAPGTSYFCTIGGFVGKK